VSFSRLLLVAVSSKKYISGEGKDKVFVHPRASLSSNDLYAGEVVLCFQLDDRKDKEKAVSRSLGIQEGDRRCDGLIFYAQDEQENKVICLVEMKSTSIVDAAEQLKSTRDHIKSLLVAECGTYCHKQLQLIKWKACFYHHGASPDNVVSVLKQLKKDNFDGVDDFTIANNDVGPFLRGEVNTKELANKLRRGKKR
jgi:hypothetical protein